MNYEQRLKAERDWKEMSEELRLFFVCYENGNFHSSTSSQDIAWSTARRINGIFGELVNVQRPQYLEEVAPPSIVEQIVHSFDHPESRVRRERPMRDPNEPSFDAGIGEAAEYGRTERSRNMRDAA